MCISSLHTSQSVIACKPERKLRRDTESSFGQRACVAKAGSQIKRSTFAVAKDALFWDDDVSGLALTPTAHFIDVVEHISGVLEHAVCSGADEFIFAVTAGEKADA